MKAVIREVIITLVIALVLFFGIRITLQNSEVISGSMEPTMPIGERVLIYKLAYKFGHLPQRGDIIVFLPPPQTNSDLDFIKRIIALPGETVLISNGKVSITEVDGTKLVLNEPYISAEPNYTYGPFSVPAGNYFVLGDNRNNSSDSHTGWTVPSSDIVGRAWWVIWPFSKFGIAPNYSAYGG
jgi:signal peptidase I